jgi:hypothetical protein
VGKGKNVGVERSRRDQLQRPAQPRLYAANKRATWGAMCCASLVTSVTAWRDSDCQPDSCVEPAPELAPEVLERGQGEWLFI